MEKERRKYPRIDIDAKLSVRKRMSLSRSAAKGQNISAEGFSFVSSRKYNAGDILSLTLLLHNSSKKLRITAKVIWCKQHHDPQKPQKKYYISGIKLLLKGTKDEEKFLKIYADEIISALGSHLHL